MTNPTDLEAREAAERLVAGDPSVMGWEAVAIARAFLSTTAEIARLREAAQNVINLFVDPPLKGDPPVLDIGPILLAVEKLEAALALPSGEGRKDNSAAAGAAPLPSTAGWQPMESAPRDGTEIWVYTSEGFQRVVHWEEALSSAPDDPGHDAGWMSHDGATHPSCFYHKPQPPVDPPLCWRPLPEEPDLEQDADVAANSTPITPQESGNGSP